MKNIHEIDEYADGSQFCKKCDCHLKSSTGFVFTPVEARCDGGQQAFIDSLEFDQ